VLLCPQGAYIGTNANGRRNPPSFYEHALKGFQGKTGVMPPKGGRTDLPDDLVKQAIDHMVQIAQ